MFDKSEILDVNNNIIFIPTDINAEPEYKTAKRIPFADIAALGGTFASFADVFRKIEMPVGGLYKAILPPGMDLANAADGIFKRGFAMEKGTIVAQAKFMAVENVDAIAAINPAAIGLTIAICAVNKKLENISENQKYVIDLIMADKKSRVRGNLKMLNEIFEDYKCDPSNSEMRTTKLSQLQKIKNEALQDIDYYYWRVDKELYDRKKGINIRMDIDDIFKDMETNFKYYKIALYVYSFAAMIESVMFEKYSHKNAEVTIKRISDMNLRYKEIYTDAYNELEQTLRKTVENKVVESLADAGIAVGNVINKVPLVEKLQVDEILVDVGREVNDARRNKQEKLLAEFSRFRDSEIIPLKDNIELVDSIFNRENVIYIDGKNICIQQSKQLKELVG